MHIAHIFYHKQEKETTVENKLFSKKRKSDDIKADIRHVYAVYALDICISPLYNSAIIRWVAFPGGE